MASRQTRREACADQFEKTAPQGMVNGGDGEAEYDTKRSEKSQSNLNYLDDETSELQYTPGSRKQGRKFSRREIVGASTSKTGTREFNTYWVGGGEEDNLFTDRVMLLNGEEFQEYIDSYLALDENRRSRLQNQFQDSPRELKRRRTFEVARKSFGAGTYWKPNPGAGCQNAPLVGGSRGFNPSGTIPDYGGLEIWYDDDGEVVERLGWGGKDEASLDI